MSAAGEGMVNKSFLDILDKYQYFTGLFSTIENRNDNQSNHLSFPELETVRVDFMEDPCFRLLALDNRLP